MSDWIKHPEGDDVAVCPLPLSSKDFVNTIPARRFLTEEIIEQYYIGPGDEVFMMGRLIAHGGRQKNSPSVRHGNIAMMPSEPIKHPLMMHDQASFIVETHSISGYSGSPVFVVDRPFTLRAVPFKHGDREMGWEIRTDGPLGLWLLGIDWGHIPHYDPVVDKNNVEHPDGWRVRSTTSMMGVVPAWRLQSLLEIPELLEQRKNEDKRLWKEMTEASEAMAIDTQLEGDTATATFTKEDFEDALRNVSRKIKE